MQSPSKLKFIQVTKEFPLKPEHTTKIYYHHNKSYKTSQVPKHNKTTKEFYEELWFIWTIKRSVKTTEYILGDAIPQPYGYCQQINEYITSENLVTLLNTSLELEFNYTPKNYDMLIINPKYISNTFSSTQGLPAQYTGIGIAFIYLNNQWTINKGFDHLDREYQDINTGIAEITL